MVKQDDLDLFLTPEDVGSEAKVTFADPGSYVMIKLQDGDKRVFRIGVELASGEVRLWTPNKTSRRTISRYFGDDTEEWVGKSVVLYTTEQMVGPNKKQVIYVRSCIK